MTTSLQQVLRFLDHVQEAFNVDIVTAEIEQLSIEEEEEEEKPSLSKLEAYLRPLVKKIIEDTLQENRD